MGVSEKRHNFHFGVEYPFNVKYVFCSVSIEIGSGTSKIYLTAEKIIVESWLFLNI